MSDSCCGPAKPKPKVDKSCCSAEIAHQEDESCHDHQRADWMFWGCFIVLAATLLASPFQAQFAESVPWLQRFVGAEVELVQTMWLGMLIGVFSVGLMSLLPKSTLIAALGEKRTIGNIFKAASAGIILDLCNHGILLIAAKLYRSGVRYSQVLAFLIASPWNSLSLTIVMFALLGWQWTLAFIGLSFLVAVVTGCIVQWLEGRGSIADNPHRLQQEQSEKISIKEHFNQVRSERGLINILFVDSFKESKMIMRWLLLGMILAGLIKTFVSQGIMETWLGPTLLGLGLTLVAATIIEVCSEGLLPIAADLMGRAAAPGNAFAFLMAGVSTDYTEIMVLRETTGRWRLAFLLPLVSLPQIIILGLMLNNL